MMVGEDGLRPDHHRRLGQCQMVAATGARTTALMVAGLSHEHQDMLASRVAERSSSIPVGLTDIRVSLVLAVRRPLVSASSNAALNRHRDRLAMLNPASVEIVAATFTATVSVLAHVVPKLDPSG